ncbi:MAG: thioredoxin [Pseudomonadales bacterium]
MSTIPITSSDRFRLEVLDAGRPVLVDFYADWCGPCQAMTPILEQFAKTQSGTVDVVKVNIDQDAELAASYGVRSIPSLVLFSDGEPVATQVGVQSLAQLNQLIQ